jgi:transposase-like protein
MARGERFWEQVLSAVDGGGTHAAVAERFDVSVSAVRYWISKRRQAGSSQLLPVRVIQSSAARVELDVEGVVVRILDGAAPEYVAALVRALRSC